MHYKDYRNLLIFDGMTRENMIFFSRPLKDGKALDCLVGPDGDDARRQVDVFLADRIHKRDAIRTQEAEGTRAAGGKKAKKQSREKKKKMQLNESC